MLVQPVSCLKIPYINPLKGIVINYQNGGDWKSMDAPMCGFGNWWQSLWTNVCIELYLKDLSICNACRPYVGFMVKRRIKQRRSSVDQGDIQEKIQRMVLWRVEPKVAGVSGVYTPESPVKNVLKKKKIEWVIMFLQDIIIRREKKRCKVDQDVVQVQDGYLEETICIKLAS